MKNKQSESEYVVIVDKSPHEILYKRKHRYVLKTYSPYNIITLRRGQAAAWLSKRIIDLPLDLMQRYGPQFRRDFSRFWKEMEKENKTSQVVRKDNKKERSHA